MLFCLALVSCKDDFDIQKLQDHSRLVVYCFPTEGDTTLVSVAKSLPVASMKGNVDILSREKVDAHIIYKVNFMRFPSVGEVDRPTLKRPISSASPFG